MARAAVILAACLASCLCLAAAPESGRRAVPAFGLMFNDDGGGSFLHPSVEQSVETVKRNARLAATAGIRTYIYCTGSGTKIHPTRAGSSIGWRKTQYDDQTVEQFRRGIAAGIHVIPIAAKEFAVARKRLHPGAGRSYFFISHRISDDHLIYNPTEFPSTEKFQIDHPDLTIGLDRSPIGHEPRYGNLLDFTHDSVRQYKLGVMSEEIELYQDVIDGYEIDFTRSPFLFARDTGPQKTRLVTELVAAIRAKLDAMEQSHRRPFFLMVRVPPSLETSMWAGIDVRDWLARRLVDVVVPAHVMVMASDLPLEPFLELANPSGAKVYAAVQLRTSYYWPFKSDLSQEDYKRPVLVSPGAEDLSGAALNHLAMGAHGIQLFNMGPIYTRPDSETLTDEYALVYRVLCDPVGNLDRASYIFAIAGYHYYRQEKGPEYPKPIPATLEADVGKTFRLYVGMDLKSRPQRSTILRLGFKQTEIGDLRFVVNGRDAHHGPVDPQYLIRPTPAEPIAETDDLLHQPPRLYARVPISPQPFQAGWNDVQVVTSKRVDLLELKVGSFVPPGVKP